MKILITADIHNGIPGRIRDTTWSMDIMRQYATKHNIRYVLVLGDMFHDRQSVGIDVLNAVYDQLKLARDSGQNWVCFPGNHDMFLKNSWDINTLRPLEGVLSVLSDISELTAGKSFRVLPFIHQESEYMKALEKLADDKCEILLTHIGVHGATLNECFLLKNWSVVKFDDTPYKRVYTGHFHCQQQVGEKVWYPGSPIPFRFDEGSSDHGFLVYDTEADTHEFVKTFEVCEEFSDYRPPDYLTIPDVDVTKYLEDVEGNNVKIVLTRDYTLNERTRIKKALATKGVQKVAFMLPKKKIEEVDETAAINHLGTPKELFQSWLDHDKPKLDRALLLKAHAPIVRQAEERIVKQEAEDG